MYASGYILESIQPKLRFSEFNPFELIKTIIIRLFLSSLGIVAIQFLLNLIWNDFLKPFGLGFLALIMGIITSSLKWKYVDFVPYAYPNLAVGEISKISPTDVSKVKIFDTYSLYSCLFALGIFIIGYFIVAKKAIK